MRNTRVELDLSILEANLDCLRGMISTKAQIMFAVKADAYGHGLEPVSRTAWSRGVRWFAVAHVEEALSLRSILPEAEILIMGVIDPDQVAETIECGAVAAIVDADNARAMNRAAATVGSGLRCHIKVDTGMGRLGCQWNEAAAMAGAVSRCEWLNPEGIYTHFASSDRGTRDFAETQAQRFIEAVAAFEAAGVTVAFRHVSNSGGVTTAESWDMSAVRPGIMLYGYPPLDGAGGERARAAAMMRPFLQWKTRVAQVREVQAGFPVSYGSTHVTKGKTRIGVLDAGYSDGYPRSLSNKGVTLVGGRRCPVIGIVTMNMTCVDLGIESRVKAGDEAVLLGEQGGESIWADELGGLAGTISYEILTNIRASDRAVV